MSTKDAPALVTPSSISRRRNGLNPACEPCRKAKVGCDRSTTTSTQETCSRCRKRQQPSLCIVLDAPMTGATPKTTPVPANALRSRIRAAQAKSTTPKSTTPKSRTLSQSISNSPEDKVNERLPDSTGFFGSTSFSATLRQAANGLREVQGEFDHDPQSLSANSELAVKVLTLLPSKAICEMLVEKYVSNSGEVLFSKAAVRHILTRLFSEYGNEMKEPRGKEGLERMGCEFTKNTRKPLEQSDEAEAWKASFSGCNTRWETFGLLFCGLAFGVAAIDERDGFFTSIGRERKAYLREMKRGVEMCVELCGGSLNMLVCNLLYKNLLLETVIHGDASLTVWRLHHDLVAMVTALGINSYQGTPNVTIHSEMTKRLSSCCFWSDKEISIFTGRPPALSRHYHSCPLPLDISDDALFAGGHVLQQELDSLDENGWNTKQVIYNSTICRMLVLAGIIQDEVSEIFLGNREWSLVRINALKLKAAEIYTSVPMIMQVTKESLLLCSSDETMWRLLFCRCDYLRIQFHLERLASERGQQSQQKLFKVAREMVDLVVFLWLQRDRWRDRRYDYDYVIMCYGMPSTGVLCSALLKQAQFPTQVDTSSKIPSSEVVQILSLMIGFLEWIDPSAGNYKLCQRMAKVIKRVLDQVFDPSPEVQVMEGQEALWQQAGGQMGGEGGGWMMDGLSDWDWLNSIDWSHGPFMDLNLQ